MLFQNTLPKKADIFIKTKQPKLFRIVSPYYKPVLILKTLGIVTSCMLVGLFLLLSTQKSLTSAAVREAETGPSINDSHGKYNDEDGQNYSNNSNNWNIQPIKIQPPVIPVIEIANPYPQNTQSSGQNLGAISSQLAGIQQAIGNQMQMCVTNARLLANQIIGLKNQQKQIQNHIDNLRQQEFNIDTSTEEGQKRRDALDKQIQALQDQSDALDTNINNTQTTYNQRNSDCQDRVNQLKQNRSDVESNLDDAFNKAMDINTDISNY